MITTLIGSFAWPFIIYFGLILFIFPRDGESKYFYRKKLSAYLTAFSTLLLLISQIWLYFFEKVETPLASLSVNNDFVFLSIICVLVYFYFGVKNLLIECGMPDLKKIWNTVKIERIMIAFSLFTLLQVFLVYVSANDETALSTIDFIKRTIIASIARPANFYLAHIVYFGPTFLVLPFIWKGFARIIRKFGFGLFLMVTGNFILSLNSESRMIILAFPFIVVLLVSVLEEQNLSYWFYLSFMIISFVFSKIWLPLGNIKLAKEYVNFPLQWYFMNYGPWIADNMYIVQGLITLLAAVFLRIIIRKHMIVRELD